MSAHVVDPAAYRDAIGSFATGVAVVTCATPEGPAGLTTNALSSLSLEPLLLLVCFDESSRTLPAVERAGRFAVNVLAADQLEVASAFASKRTAEEKFSLATHRIEHDVPVLDGAVAWLACDLRELRPVGDHVIGIGEVTHVHAREGDPLLFHRGVLRPLGG